MAQSDIISHVDTVISHIDTGIFHIDTATYGSSSITIRSSSISILSFGGHFRIDTAVWSSCGQDDEIISCHSAVAYIALHIIERILNSWCGVE
jgi:hypothetical protein